MVSSLALLQSEIRHELNSIGEDQFPEVERLAIGKIDSVVLQKTRKFIRSLRSYYNSRYNTAYEKKEAMKRSMTDTPQELLQYETARTTLTNKAVIEAVENKNSASRVVSYKGALIQKFYPIYIPENRPSHFFDFSANLYQPTKHFAGREFYTLYFNVAVIWVLTIGFFIALYFDVLKRLIKRLERSRKYRVKEK
jgi:hypothetical protein